MLKKVQSLFTPRRSLIVFDDVVNSNGEIEKLMDELSQAENTIANLEVSLDSQETNIKLEGGYTDISKSLQNKIDEL